MQSIHDIVSSIANEPKTNKKLDIIQSNKDNQTLKDWFFYTLNPYINYWIKAHIPEQSGNITLDSELIRSVSDNLSTRKVTGNEARSYLNSILESLSKNDQELLCNMINHDPNCKVAAKTVNKVWQNLIPSFDVMLCEEYTPENAAKHMVEGNDSIIVQKKEDGGRIHIVVKDGVITAYTRNGNIIQTHGFYDMLFKSYDNMVFDGEFLVVDDFGVCDRKTGNGIFNKAVRGTITEQEIAKSKLVLWDVIPLNDFISGKCNIKYKDRLKSLVDIVDSIGQPHRTSVVYTKYVSYLYQAVQVYDTMIQDKQEGVIIKSSNAIWEAKRSYYALKLKETHDCTLKCIAVVPHSKKSGCIGSLTCVSDDGMITTNVGSGLTEDDTMKAPEEYLDKCIDVLYNSVISNKSDDKFSLFLPRFKGVRSDKTDTDVLDMETMLMKGK